MSLLEVTQLDVRYGHCQALRGISLTVAEGGVTALIGANGAGKSTTLMSISRIVNAHAGEIRFGGESLRKLSPAEVVRRGVVQVPEGRRVFPRMSVWENLQLGGFLTRDPNLLRQREEQVYTLFPRLKERLQQAAGTLSGGEQQMLALGRAMMSGPKLLLLDEPSLGLAPVIIQRIFEALLEINRRGTSILLVEQNARLALEVSQSAYVLENGSVSLSGPSARLLRDPRVAELYLGGTASESVAPWIQGQTNHAL